MIPKKPQNGGTIGTIPCCDIYGSFKSLEEQVNIAGVLL
jgi:hypothetical protein